MTNDKHIKDPQAVLPYEWDWRPWLSAGETITSHTVTATPAGLTVSGVGEAAGVVTATLAGGTIGEIYRVTCHIETSGGLVDDRTKKVTIRDR